MSLTVAKSWETFTENEEGVLAADDEYQGGGVADTLFEFLKSASEGKCVLVVKFEGDTRVGAYVPKEAQKEKFLKAVNEFLKKQRIQYSGGVGVICGPDQVTAANIKTIVTKKSDGE